MPKKKPNSTQSIALIGTRGFRGHKILEGLEKNPKYTNVIAIDYQSPKMKLKKVKFYKHDLTATLADVKLTEILKQENIDTVIHAATPITPFKNESLAHEIIAIGSYYIANACQAAGVRKVVMNSTADVYGAFAENPNFLVETDTPKAFRQSRFLADKIDAENQMLKFAKKCPGAIVSIMRPCTIVGPNIYSYKTRYLNRLIIPTVLGFDPLLQFIHEDDMMRALFQLIDEDHPGIFNLAGDKVLPLSRVIEICGATKLPVLEPVLKTMATSMWLLDIAPAPASHVDFLKYLCIVDNQKAKDELNFYPKYTSKEALRSFVKAKRLRQIRWVESL